MSIIESLLDRTVTENATDLFLSGGKVPCFRKNGEIVRLPEETTAPGEIDSYRLKTAGPDGERKYQETGGVDAGAVTHAGNRFRLNFIKRQGMPSMAARPVLDAGGLTFEGLGLPPIVKELAESERGLILIAGTAGSGKSTTMAAIVNHINSFRKRHIITVEDPIEFIHHDKQSLITSAKSAPTPPVSQRP